MERVEKILSHLDKNGLGVEIGPSYNPAAPKRAGFKVHIIDHATREELIEKYTNHNVPLDNIEEVDFVWTGQPYTELVGKSKYYDWIIASHLIEHVPDFIGFLQNCDSILKDEGVLSLVVPDHRYCFDTFRPMSGLSKFVDAHVRRDVVHTTGTAVEHHGYVVKKGNSIAWHANFPGEYKFAYPFQAAQDSIDAQKSGASSTEFQDYHAWCFTPNSFRLIIQDLYSLGLIPFQEIAFFPTTNSCEFFIALGRRGKGSGISRLELLSNIRREVREWACEGLDMESVAEHNSQDDIRKSLSWRLTAPLRRVHSWFRRR
jgi:SAM-dependent methyltransferase